MTCLGIELEVRAQVPLCATDGLNAPIACREEGGSRREEGTQTEMQSRDSNQNH